MTKKLPIHNQDANTRIVLAAAEVWSLSESRSHFASRYFGHDKDVIFLTNGDAQVVDRMSMLVYHGAHAKPQFQNASLVSVVYCGLEKSAYTLANYGKLLRSVYFGRVSKTPTTRITEVSIT